MGDYLCSFTDCVSQRRGRRVLDRPSTVALIEQKEERGADGADGCRGHVHSDGGSRGPLGCEQRLLNPAAQRHREKLTDHEGKAFICSSALVTHRSQSRLSCPSGRSEANPDPFRSSARLLEKENKTDLTHTPTQLNRSTPLSSGFYFITSL